MVTPAQGIRNVMNDSQPKTSTERGKKFREKAKRENKKRRELPPMTDDQYEAVKSYLSGLQSGEK